MEYDEYDRRRRRLEYDEEELLLLRHLERSRDELLRELDIFLRLRDRDLEELLIRFRRDLRLRIDPDDRLLEGDREIGEDDDDLILLEGRLVRLPLDVDVDEDPDEETDRDRIFLDGALELYKR
ncbi:unnamed protein product [Rodentolepis nana]|uniref:Uncharacterized protein n=1 Tax=Rodentolepis nana TaxID=102285 RepID=A0A3P7TIM4_RODNA|nr:unnamed protein product [Rodentolepis nana]